MADLNELLVMQLDPIEASTVWTGRFNQYEGIRISPNDPGEYLWYPGTLETWAAIQTTTGIDMYRLDADNVAPGVKSGDIADEVVPTLTFRAFWTSLGQSLEWSVAEIHGWFPSPEAKPWEGNQTYVYVEFLGAPVASGGSANPDRADTVQFSLLTGSSAAVSRKTWTYRRDFRPTDAFLAPSSGAVSIETDSVFRVRYHPAWTPGRSFAVQGRRVDRPGCLAGAPAGPSGRSGASV